MRNNRRMAFATAVMLFALSISIAAQSRRTMRKRPDHGPPPTARTKTRRSRRLWATGSSQTKQSRTPTDVPDEMQANRQEQISEEAAVNPYYNNFFSTYRLGPEDMISVEVFNQERYSRAGIIDSAEWPHFALADTGRSFRQRQDGRRSGRDHQEAVRRVHHRSAGDGVARKGIVISLQHNRRRGPTRRSSDESPHDRDRGDRRSGRRADHRRQEQGCRVAAAGRTACWLRFRSTFRLFTKARLPTTPISFRAIRSLCPATR